MDIKSKLKKIQENILDNNSVTRYSICEGCEHFHNFAKVCMQCGCFMPAKTRLKSSNCPLGKW